MHCYISWGYEDTDHTSNSPCRKLYDKYPTFLQIQPGHVFKLESLQTRFDLDVKRNLFLARDDHHCIAIILYQKFDHIKKAV